MNMIQTRVIPGFGGMYLIARTGRVVSLHKNRKRILPGRKNKDGYIQVALFINGRRHDDYIHRLVAKAFIPNPEGKPEVNHINGIKTDNRVENLEWCTRDENMDHAFKAGLSNQKLGPDEVTEIRRQYRLGRRQVDLAREFGVSKQQINDIVHWKRWKNIPASDPGNSFKKRLG